MSIKRIILANHSRLLLEMFQRALNQAEHLEVVHEVFNHEELPLAIQRFCPEWVIISLPVSESLLSWISACIEDHSPIGFIFLSPDHRRITMRWQMALEEDLSNLSLKEFIYLLENDRQHL